MKMRGNKRQVSGIVLSDKMDKTIVVMAERLVKHEQYKKYVRRRNKFTVHDEENKCKVGDKVLITESRPLSKMKRWRVTQIVKKAVSI